MKNTINYYNLHAENFIENTQHVDMRAAQDRFLKHLAPATPPTPPMILDFGCGSGRDTKDFLERGYRVTATDGSQELCRLASAYTGIDVRCMLFQELDEFQAFDGIWACASILHLPRAELLPVLQNMCRALKPGGVIYTSFKYGNFEGERNGRYFTDFTEESFHALAGQIPELTIEEGWITGDVRPGIVSNEL